MNAERPVCRSFTNTCYWGQYCSTNMQLTCSRYDLL